ncbi:MAG: MFS transporter [Candidatus Eisenbacteria bacterium]|uniref:MFS transporter n=1 Tax=Eiseniibacteriota bacterium TaxID=2212470 RepID=A0A933SED3_UNCEI|nr:MFS transporter [Candidatus Eisenbacteria bacterium]
MTTTTATRPTWRFPRAFWTANLAELFERAAYYGTFIALRTYLLRVVHLSDVEAGWIAGLFGALIYLFPFISGALADRLGFRHSLMLAFGLLALGYGALGVVHDYWPVMGALLLVVLGGSFVKPVITGTAMKSSDESSRARAFSLFYMIVNIGSFTGKTIVAPIRIQMGVQNVPFFSAAAAFVGFLIVAFLFFPKEETVAKPRSIGETFKGMLTVMSNLRFTSLILITAGFWAIQGQLYASMPDYVIRMAGETYKPEWYANVNPLVVVMFVVLITQLVRTWKPEASILVAMTLIPLSSLAMALSPMLHGNVNVFGAMVHPITLMMVVGIAIQGLAECFLSPKYLEFASKQAPAGREGLYLGYAHMNTFFAWLFGFVFAGYMLKAFCPDPSTLPADVQAQHAAALAGAGPMPAAYAHAHYLWYAFAGVGALSLIAMLVFIAVTNRRPAR